MTQPSSIRMIPQKDFTAGCCWICDQPAILKWRDSDLPMVFMGDCCYGALVLADKALMNGNFLRPGGQKNFAGS